MPVKHKVVYGAVRANCSIDAGQYLPLKSCRPIPDHRKLTSICVPHGVEYWNQSPVMARHMWTTEERRNNAVFARMVPRMNGASRVEKRKIEVVAGILIMQRVGRGRVVRDNGRCRRDFDRGLSCGQVSRGGCANRSAYCYPSNGCPDNPVRCTSSV